MNKCAMRGCFAVRNKINNNMEHITGYESDGNNLKDNHLKQAAGRGLGKVLGWVIGKRACLETA